MFIVLPGSVNKLVRSFCDVCVCLHTNTHTHTPKSGRGGQLQMSLRFRAFFSIKIISKTKRYTYDKNVGGENVDTGIVGPFPCKCWQDRLKHFCQGYEPGP